MLLAASILASHYVLATCLCMEYDPTFWQPSIVRCAISSVTTTTCVLDVAAGVERLQVHPHGSGGTPYFYAVNYGAECMPHDANVEPFCHSSSPPSWCMDSWCYVDPSQSGCEGHLVRSKYFSAEVYYSYSACGMANSYDQWYANRMLPSSIDHNLLVVIERYAKSNVIAAEAATAW